VAFLRYGNTIQGRNNKGLEDIPTSQAPLGIKRGVASSIVVQCPREQGIYALSQRYHVLEDLGRLVSLSCAWLSLSRAPSGFGWSSWPHCRSSREAVPGHDRSSGMRSACQNFAVAGARTRFHVLAKKRSCAWTLSICASTARCPCMASISFFVAAISVKSFEVASPMAAEFRVSTRAPEGVAHPHACDADAL
jgi:hypothetical protein